MDFRCAHVSRQARDPQATRESPESGHVVTPAEGAILAEGQGERGGCALLALARPHRLQGHRALRLRCAQRDHRRLRTAGCMDSHAWRLAPSHGSVPCVPALVLRQSATSRNRQARRARRPRQGQGAFPLAPLTTPPSSRRRRCARSAHSRPPNRACGRPTWPVVSASPPRAFRHFGEERDGREIGKIGPSRRPYVPRPGWSGTVSSAQ